MGVSTFLIGLLPGYDAIGVAAPILLGVLRFVQGLGLGGEWGGAVIMSIEHGDPRRRGFNASWPQVGVPAGFIMATALPRHPERDTVRGPRSCRGAGGCRSCCPACWSWSASGSG
ncbi:hypothetical protein [Nonomuraea dietziae]|uniref:hypothetical protein n=1 Tax=Nonomuraea dietziae TaxID=65515 RepID=UPI003CD0ADD8